MNTDQYVSHPSFSREQLHGKQLAVCKEGNPARCTVHCSPARPDGKYTLTLAFGLSLVPSGANSPSNLGKEPLDQATVDRIEVVEKGSPLSRMRFEFALMQDAISATLTRDDTPKLKIDAPPPIPLPGQVMFDPSNPPNPIAR